MKKINALYKIFSIISFVAIVILLLNLIGLQVQAQEQNAEQYNTLTLRYFQEKQNENYDLLQYFTKNCERHLLKLENTKFESEREYDYVYFCLETTQLKIFNQLNELTTKG